MGLWGSIKRGATSAVKDVGKAAVGTVKAAGSTVGDVAKGVGNVAQAVGDVATLDFKGAGKNLSQAGGNVVDTIRDAGRTAVGAVNTVGLTNPLGFGINMVNDTIRDYNKGNRPAYNVGAEVGATMGTTPQAPPPAPTPQYEPVKTPQQMEAEREAAAAALLANQPTKQQDAAPDSAVKRYDLADMNIDPLTEAGTMYRDNVNKGLKTGEFSEVTAALQRAGRENRLQESRAQMQGEAMAAQAGMTPGTPEYQRFVDMANAQAQAQNLDRDNSVNALQRAKYEDAMNRGQKLETEGYDRATGERKTSMEADAAEFTVDDARYESTQADIRDYVSQLPANLQGIARKMMANGQDPRTNSFFNASGSVAEPFRGQDPAVETYSNTWTEQSLLTPRIQGESTESWQARVSEAARKRTTERDAVSNNPTSSANRENQVQDSYSTQLEGLAQSGSGFTPKTWKDLLDKRPDLIQSMPVKENITKTGYSNSKAGDVVEYNGQKYVIVNPRHHPKKKVYGNTRAKDGILAMDENGKEVEIAMTGWYDPD